MVLNRLTHWQWTYNGNAIRDELVPFSEIENPHILHKARSKNGSKKKTCVKNYVFSLEGGKKIGLSQTLLFSSQHTVTVPIFWLHSVMLWIGNGEGSGILHINDKLVIN